MKRRKRVTKALRILFIKIQLLAAPILFVVTSLILILTKSFSEAVVLLAVALVGVFNHDILMTISLSLVVLVFTPYRSIAYILATLLVSTFFVYPQLMRVLNRVRKVGESLEREIFNITVIGDVLENDKNINNRGEV